ncbi:MAG: PPOX class F420-dependent oxidoreductase [Thermoleophilia bacterium]|nr:PPOX class F420-dependent oxidoreductase [Thermoleophilia bacterium]
MALTPAQTAFIHDNPFVAVVTTLREDGSPHSTVVWADADGEGVSFNTAYGLRKPRHIEHDPRVSVTVVDPADPFRWVSVSGVARFTDEDAEEQIERLSLLYTGEDFSGWRVPGEQRVKVRVSAERVGGWGLDG